MPGRVAGKGTKRITENRVDYSGSDFAQKAGVSEQTRRAA